MPYDVIVVGAGAMGSAAACHLARRGQRVLVIERHAIGHDRGSSHGLSRIIRLAYFEHPDYVPLLRRAFALWRQLERDAGRRLLHVTGSLDVGRESGEVFAGSRRSCEVHALPHEVWTARDLQRRVPAWRAPDHLHAVFQPDGGFLVPERCVEAHAGLAVEAGADVRVGERVAEWSAGAGVVRVRTDRGRYEAGQLVLAAGAWMPELSPALATLLAPERQVVGWFAASDAGAFAPERFPVFVLEADEGTFYGFPEHGVAGFKIGKYHHRSERAGPDSLDRACRPEDEAALREGVARYFPSANGALLSASPCLFTNAPDGHFIIDRDPGAPEVLLVSPCSGHGFKFSAVIGEIVADLVTTGTTGHNVGLFGLARFGSPRAT